MVHLCQSIIVFSSLLTHPIFITQHVLDIDIYRYLLLAMINTQLHISSILMLHFLDSGTYQLLSSIKGTGILRLLFRNIITYVRLILGPRFNSHSFISISVHLSPFGYRFMAMIPSSLLHSMASTFSHVALSLI